MVDTFTKQAILLGPLIKPLKTRDVSYMLHSGLTDIHRHDQAPLACQNILTIKTPENETDYEYQTETFFIEPVVEGYHYGLSNVVCNIIWY